MLAGLTGLLGGGGGGGTAFESIATFSPTSGSSVTFNSIPSTYKHLQIRYAITTSAYADIRFRINGDTGSNYTYHV